MPSQIYPSPLFLSLTPPSSLPPLHLSSLLPLIFLSPPSASILFSFSFSSPPLPSFSLFPPSLSFLFSPPSPQVWLHDGLSLSDDDHELCAKVETTAVPAEGYFGISAATGGLSDDHDVLKFLAYSLLPSEERTEEVRGEGRGGGGRGGYHSNYRNVFTSAVMSPT